MKKLLLVVTALLGLHSNIVLAMDKPNAWQPLRPSGSGRPSRPRPQAINYGKPQISNSPAQVQPIVPTATISIATPTLNPIHVQPSQSTAINLMHIINTAPIGTESSSTATTHASSITPTELHRLCKIKEDLDEIEEVLKEMGFDLAFTALSVVTFDLIEAAFSASNSIITIPKLAYYYGNMQKHIFYLSSSKTSIEAKKGLELLTPRLQVVSKVITNGPAKLQMLIKKFSKEDPKKSK